MYPLQYIPFPQGNYTFEFGIYHFHGVFFNIFITYAFSSILFGLHCMYLNFIEVVSYQSYLFSTCSSFTQYQD